MSAPRTFAVLHPTNLLGQELREALEARPELWQELRLLSTDDREVGALTEVRGAAAMVQRLGEGDLAAVEVAFFCGAAEATRPLLARLPEGLTAIVLSPDANAGDGRPVVAGINTADAAAGETLLSPNPAAVLLCHLLHPLLPFRPRLAAATVVQPASIFGQPGLDELYEQTRNILAFSGKKSEAVFGRQLAFNLYPPEVGGELTALVRGCVGGGEALPLAVTVVQGGVFHGLAASLYVDLGEDPGAAGLHRALRRHPALELLAERRAPSPVDAANRDKVLVGAVHAVPREPGGYWLWAVMDNLTTGGALNALGLLEAVLASGG